MRAQVLTRLVGAGTDKARLLAIVALLVGTPVASHAGTLTGALTFNTGYAPSIDFDLQTYGTNITSATGDFSSANGVTTSTSYVAGSPSAATLQNVTGSYAYYTQVDPPGTWFEFQDPNFLTFGQGRYVFSTDAIEAVPNAPLQAVDIEGTLTDTQGVFAPTLAYFEAIQSNGSPMLSGENLQVTGTAASPVPLPAAAWLMLSGLGGLGAMTRKRKAA